MTASTVSVSTASLLAVLLSKVLAGAATRAVLTAVWANAAPGSEMATIVPAVESNLTSDFPYLPGRSVTILFFMINYPDKKRRV